MVANRLRAGRPAAAKPAGVRARARRGGPARRGLLEPRDFQLLAVPVESVVPVSVLPVESVVLVSVPLESVVVEPPVS